MYSLLIVDDEESMLEGLRTLVDWDSLGFKLVGECRGGQEAMAFLDNRDVNVVLTDLRMPQGSGLDIARHVREKRLRARVLLLSGYRDFDAAQAAIRYGVRHYLTKPFLPSQLKEIMGEVAGELDAERTMPGLSGFETLEEMRRFMLESFCLEAASGALRSDYAFGRWVEILHIDGEYLRRRCALFDTVWEGQIDELIHRLRAQLAGAYACAFRLPDTRVRMLFLEDDEALDGAAFAEKLALCTANRMERGPVAENVRALSLRLPPDAEKEASHGTPNPAARDLPKGGGEPNAAMTACRYIQTHFAEKLQLTDVAKLVHLNPSYLSRMFREQTGYTFSDYLANQRVQAASRMLATTGRAVGQICKDVGYDDVKHFYKLFKQVMGVTPSEYRQMAKEQQTI